jgi:hypothetical protein
MAGDVLLHPAQESLLAQRFDIAERASIPSIMLPPLKSNSPLSGRHAGSRHDPAVDTMFEMPRPSSGDYQIAATGTADGTYSLDVWFDDQNGTTGKMPTMTDVAIGRVRRTVSCSPMHRMHLPIWPVVLTVADSGRAT